MTVDDLIVFKATWTLNGSWPLVKGEVGGRAFPNMSSKSASRGSRPPLVPAVPPNERSN